MRSFRNDGDPENPDSENEPDSGQEVSSSPSAVPPSSVPGDALRDDTPPAYVPNAGPRDSVRGAGPGSASAVPSHVAAPVPPRARTGYPPIVPGQLIVPPPLMTRSETLKAHGKTAGRALMNWWRAASIDALCVAAMWLAGLLLLRVPFAPLWALIGGVMTFVPAVGGVISVIGPVLAVLFSGHDEFRLGLVLGLYAVIVVVEQLFIQPMLMKRVTRVPIWLSILAPIVLGIVIPFWGVLLAPPLLAVVFAFRRPRARIPGG